MRKVRVIKQQEIWINGSYHQINEGVQELEDHIAELLLNLELAEEETDDKHRTGKRVSKTE